MLNNLGEPIAKTRLGIIDHDKIQKALGIFNLAFGMGKVFGSLLSGSLAKIIGKLNILFIAEIFNLLAIALLFWKDEYLFIISRVLTGICCGFNTTNAPR